jgi:hypothetical protein
VTVSETLASVDKTIKDVELWIAQAHDVSSTLPGPGWVPRSIEEVKALVDTAPKYLNVPERECLAAMYTEANETRLTMRAILNDASCAAELALARVETKEDAVIDQRDRAEGLNDPAMDTHEQKSKKGTCEM